MQLAAFLVMEEQALNLALRGQLYFMLPVAAVVGMQHFQ